MDMFTSYGKLRSQNKITDFLMILARASPFDISMKPPKTQTNFLYT